MKACGDTEALDAYVSGELDANQAASVAAHVANCRLCAKEVAARSALRRELAGVLGRGEDASAGANDRNAPLRERVLAAVDEPEAAAHAARARTAGSLAAAVVIAAIAGWWSARALPPLRDAPLERPTVASVDASAYADALVNHLACGMLQRFPEGSTEAESRQRLGQYAAILDVVAASPDFELVHAHVCPNRNRRFGHLVLQRDGETVSVLVTDKNDGAGLPAADRSASHSAIVGVIDFPIVELAGLESKNLMGFIATPKRGLDAGPVFALATELERTMKTIENPAASSANESQAR